MIFNNILPAEKARIVAAGGYLDRGRANGMRGHNKLLFVFSLNL